MRLSSSSNRTARGMVSALLVACVVVAAAVAGPARAATPEEVDKAVERGIEALYGMLGPDGRIGGDVGGHGVQQGGYEAIAVYALLAARESHQDPRLKRAIETLSAIDMKGTYALGLRAQIWQYLPKTAETRAGIAKDAALLAANVRQTKKVKVKDPKDSEKQIEVEVPHPHRGMFHYGPTGDGYDHSCSNYGVLGFWGLALAGWEVPTPVWQAFDGGWRERQHKDGSWEYVFRANNDNHPPSLSMTTAGVATLYITQDYLHGMKGLNCTGNVTDPALEQGIKWISERASKDRINLYTWYNMERIGVASGHKYFGDLDWYAKGSEILVRSQTGDGSWNGDWGGRVTNTAWALVFLVRGRAPVMMNKLDYLVHTGGDKTRPPGWNQRPRDVANLTRWVGKSIEKDLNWQIVSLRANADDLHDSPILYVAGKDALNFTPEEERRLKQFVEEGGMIVGNADCTSLAFSNSFKKLGTKLFGYEFRELPEGHVLYTSQQYARSTWKTKPMVHGLTNGVRELMLLFPTQDPAKGWQVQAFGGQDREPLAQAAANMFLYSVDKQNLNTKGRTHVVRAKGGEGSHKIRVARLQYPGNWDPEPGAWRRMAAVMRNKHDTSLQVATVKLGEGKLDKSYHVAHLTGTARYAFTPAAVEEMKKYVEAGGTLLIDAAGGNPEFALQIEGDVRKMFPDANPAMMTVSHPMYGAAGEKIEEVEYRTHAKKLLGAIRTPRLRVHEVAGRAAVIVSNEDLTAGLVGQHVDGIVGYVPSALKLAGGKPRSGATEIVASLLLHAHPAPKPAEGTGAAAKKAEKGSGAAAPAKPTANAEKEEPAKPADKPADKPKAAEPKKDAPKGEPRKKDAERRSAPPAKAGSGEGAKRK